MARAYNYEASLRRSAEVRRQRRLERMEQFRQVLEQEPCLKRAAWKVGIAERTACTYRQELLATNDPALERRVR